MPDKNLTDNEIIKACEWYLTIANRVHSVTLSKDEIHELYDLINRLQADKQSLIEHLKKARRQLKTAKAEIERLLTENHSLAIVQEGFKDMYKIAEAEARKEFAERIISEHSFEYYGDKIVLEADIYNLLIEMGLNGGENNG